MEDNQTGGGAAEAVKPDAVARGEAAAPPTSDPVPDESTSEKPPKAPKKAKTPKVATATKGTTGASTTSADGSPIERAGLVGGIAGAQAVQALVTTTGSDATQTGVYNGESPMSPEDRYKASQGRDPLNTVIPDGAAYGNMSMPFMAEKTAAPIGPTGNVPTGAPHAAVAEAQKLVKPIVDATDNTIKDADPA